MSAVEHSDRARLEAYLDRLGPGPLASHARCLWEAIGHELGEFTVPVVGPVEDGIQFAWTSGQRLLSIDIYPNGDADWFFYDPEFGVTDAGEITRIAVGLDFLLNTPKMLELLSTMRLPTPSQTKAT